MADASRQQTEWLDGFLFVGNHLALDFVNTRPILKNEPQELLPNAAALERWLAAAGIVSSRRQRTLVRAWRASRQGEVFRRNLIAFRERLRTVVLRLEAGELPGQTFLAEMNRLLKKYPQRTSLNKHGSTIVLKPLFEPRRPEDLWAPIAAATAELFSELDRSRIRKCESESCVLHFYDTSKKGSRRWCSMNICGNKLKVAAYQRRRRANFPGT
jgi:predicted RNA-binding Zn ribbon-like protein